MEPLALRGPLSILKGQPSIYFLGTQLSTVGNLPRGSIHHDTPLVFPQIVPLYTKFPNPSTPSPQNCPPNFPNNFSTILFKKKFTQIYHTIIPHNFYTQCVHLILSTQFLCHIVPTIFSTKCCTKIPPKLSFNVFFEKLLFLFYDWVFRIV